jgi:hypothetical protein
MFRRSIAAALLMVMVAWAEMALAPMLFMHTGHVHAAREMAEPVLGHTVAHHHHAMPAGHPCCPGIGKAVSPALTEFAAGTLPCQNEHRCCFQQGPQNVPAPVNARVAQGIAPAVLAEISPDRDAESHVSGSTAVAPGPPPGKFGMVLRV